MHQIAIMETVAGFGDHIEDKKKVLYLGRDFGRLFLRQKSCPKCDTFSIYSIF